MTLKIIEDMVSSYVYAKQKNEYVCWEVYFYLITTKSYITFIMVSVGSSDNGVLLS